MFKNHFDLGLDFFEEVSLDEQNHIKGGFSGPQCGPGKPIPVCPPTGGGGTGDKPKTCDAACIGTDKGVCISKTGNCQCSYTVNQIVYKYERYSASCN